MLVTTFEAHNVLGVEDIRFDMEGRHLFLVGGANGQGKTSALTALLMALCGRSGMDYPDVALREGEDKGWVKVSLTGDAELQDDKGFTVELYLVRKRGGAVVEQFRITDSTGEEAPEPRKLLKRLYHMKAFDPLSFEKMDKKARVECLKELLNLDFTEYEERYAKLYAERTLVNKEGVRLKSQFDSTPRHESVPDAEIVVSELFEELQRIEEANRENDKIRAFAEKSKSDYETAIKESDKIAKKIEDSKKALEELVRQHEEQLEKCRELDKVAFEAIGKAGSLVYADATNLREAIKNADQVNRKVRDNKKREEMAKDLAELRTKSEKLGAELESIQEKKKSLIKNAPWPVPGLAIDDQGVLLDGLPFEQANLAKRVFTSVHIGMAMNPKLRLLVCSDGGSLDLNTLKALEDVLVSNGFQMIVEIVTRTPADEGLCAVVIEEGKVKK